MHLRIINQLLIILNMPDSDASRHNISTKNVFVYLLVSNLKPSWPLLATYGADVETNSSYQVF